MIKSIVVTWLCYKFCHYHRYTKKTDTNLDIPFSAARHLTHIPLHRHHIHVSFPYSHAFICICINLTVTAFGTYTIESNQVILTFIPETHKNAPQVIYRYPYNPAFWLLHFNLTVTHFKTFTVTIHSSILTHMMLFFKQIPCTFQSPSLMV